MPDGGVAARAPRVDPAGRPIEGRGRQALTAFSIIVSWCCLTLLIFWATRGYGKEVPARLFIAMAGFAWLTAEAFGGRHAPVWPTSALAIAGSLSIGFGTGLATAHLRFDNFVGDIAIISGVASFSMLTYLFRFRLPGLVSPVITFAIISLFLGSLGINGESLSRVEGFSPRGILAALISSPIWLAGFGILGGGMVFLARRLDLHGDDFGLASARPLHLIGAGISALIIGRVLGYLPLSLDLLGLVALWIIGTLWALRINRFAIGVAIHLASAKPLIYGLSEAFAVDSLMVWRPDMTEWAIMLTAIMVINFAIWPWLHRGSLARNWTLGPGGRIPQPRKGWWWRYWPYA